MKPLFLAANIALIMSFTAALYAVEIPEDVKPEMKEILLKYGNQAEEQSKEELKKLIEDEMLKKNLEAVRKAQLEDGVSSVPTDNQKKDAKSNAE